MHKNSQQAQEGTEATKRNEWIQKELPYRIC